MVDKIAQLKQLERIARLKAERQLKSFAAFNAHMTAARNRVGALHTSLEQSYDSAAPLTLPEARVANAQAGRAARELRQADQDLQRMTPRFEVARQQAAREFGRAEVLLSLGRDAERAARKERL
ncbi:hypothetical protein D3P06_00380 [Paracoccus aestuarii]|uniref:Uncharacterized protein n=1 Tax=Paracoccus aestuarii TaxID=453842 RepID=A0A419A2W8_9RHOB|nr:hypothetical protein [Paracoccus aestuarii]RJL07562.1 hypothetical protein D3P06_00380 [Paracoccus aestuarii]WCQ99019.1 hypothetical protein JHW48_14410 [Paracoccus aestuarii]